MKKANINFLIKNFLKSCQGYDSNLEPASISLYLFFEHTKDLMSGASERHLRELFLVLSLTTSELEWISIVKLFNTTLKSYT